MLSRGWNLIRELVGSHPGPFTLAVAGSVLYAAGTVGTTMVLGRITDRVIYPTFETGEMADSTFFWVVVAVSVVTLGRSIGVVFRRFFAGMTADRNQRTFQRQLADKYLGLPLSWHQEESTGKLLAHTDSDVEVVVTSLHPLPFTVGVLCLGLFSAILMLSIDLLLALVGFTIFPALVMFSRAYTGRVEAPAAAVQRGVGEVSSIAHESFDGALVVKTLGRAEKEGERFDGAVQALRADRLKVGHLRAIFEPMLDGLPNIGIVLMLVVGVYRINSGAITIGDLVQMAALFGVLAFPMRVVGFFLESLAPAVVARERLETVLSVSEPALPPSPMSLPEGRLSLEARSVAYRYPSDLGQPANGASVAAVSAKPEAGPGPLVFNDVSLRIEPGEVVALVGSTGSGKSTLCNVLAGLLPPSQGEVELGGAPIGLVQPEERTSALAMVFQESFLFADTLRSNIDLEGADLDAGAEADRAQALAWAASIAQVDEFVDQLPQGWDTIVGERGVTLSGGQRQRVALARALIRRPRLLILDDATSAVDPKIELRILQGLRANDGGPGGQPSNESEELSGPTTLIVAQRVSTIELADRVLYLADGRIAGAGSHTELMELPGYRALVEAYEAARQ